MTFEQFVAHINASTENRFVIEDQSDIKNEMLSVAPENITNKLILRFCRQLSSGLLNHNMKTLFVVNISPDIFKDSLQWVALSKEVLLDPETADVYLFIMWKEETSPSIEECLRIEASEDFCRKFVLRPFETIESFIERTFLKKIDAPLPLDLGQDPLISAFSGLEDQFTWFDESEKTRWKEVFNTGTSGSDLFDALMTNKPKNNEAS